MISPELQEAIISSIANEYSRNIKGRSLLRTITQSIMTFVFGMAFSIPAFVLIMVMSPLYFIAPYKCHVLCSLACYIAWTFFSYYYDRQGAPFSASGFENIPHGESAFVIANHVFGGDFMVIDYLAKKKGMLGYIRYFIKRQVYHIPLFGWVMYFIGFPALDRNWRQDSGKIKKSISHIIDWSLPVWLVSHVEGTRINPKAIAESREFTDSMNMPPLNHVILPRYKGFWLTSLALRNSHIGYVYDVTMAYYHDEKGFGYTPSTWDFFLGQMSKFHVHIHVERMPLSSVPVEDAECAQWLYSRFYRKDQLLEIMKRTYEGMSIRSSSRSAHRKEQ